MATWTISGGHAKNKDQYLDYGGTYQVSSSELKGVLGTVTSGVLTGAIDASGATISGGTFSGPTLTGTVTATGATVSGGTLSAPTITGTVDASGATITSPSITGATITESTYNALTLTAATTGFTVAGGTTSKTLTVDEDATLSNKANTTLSYVSCSASATLTTSQLKGSILTNYGQEAGDVQIQLPTAEAGLSAVAVIGTTQAGNTWKMTADTNDKFYLDGTGGTDNQSVIVTPAVGNFITIFTFQTGATAYDWIAQTGQGTWTAGA